ncbi:peptidoglycan D,D-transpeptidase FtsI family protein [Brevibacillus daliensis]|uniref:peptidoglycan D,D-transpeptidase FtsI family protein n=1 Tax=Brevibacillus daliensis TaxID=2892995 RepID=UPI001E42FD08|nr:penicillin-binding transpeptidase domain-containing protein [Brevibacillus daliensis]
MEHTEQEDRQKSRAKRIQIMFLITFVLFSLIIIRLAELQIKQGSQFQEALSSRSLKQSPIPAVRGDIYDKNGKKLVTSKASFAAMFQEEEVMTKDEMILLAEKVSKVLEGTTEEEILKKMDVGYIWNKENQIVEVGRNAPTYLAKELHYDLTTEEIAYLEENQEEFTGIEVVMKPIREYDPRQIAVQSIGYVRPYNVAENLGSDFYLEAKDSYLDNQLVGLDGIERSYEEELRGKNGYRLYEVAADQSVQREVEIVQPQRGNDVYLTIDERVQLETRDFIKDFLPQLRSNISLARGAKTAYVVAIEVKTGKVVTMISYPEYDPNVWVHGPDQETYEQIKYSVTNGTIREAPYDVRPLTGEKAVAENDKHPKSIVPAGSVMKPITLLMGLNQGVITPNHSWQDSGTYYYGKGTDKISNDGHHSYGTLTPEKALAKSSNTYMGLIGEGVAKKQGKKAVSILQDNYHQFGIGVPTEIDLPNESKGKEDYLVMNEQYGPLAAIVQASFGQQVRATTMQLAQYVATLANEGKRLKPQMVDKIVNENGNVVFQSEPVVLNTIEQPKAYWDILRNGMIKVTQPGGTSVQAFKGMSYQVAAKTGTSEQDIYIPVSISDEKGESKTVWRRHDRVNNGVAISYAPANDPVLAVAVVVPEGGYGGRSASIISRAVYDAYDKHVGFK